MRTIRKAVRRGFTLIELMIVVAIIGILAVLAIYGVSRYLKSAKTAEATNNVGAIAKNASESLNREMMSGAYVAPGSSTALSHCVCQKASKPVPQNLSEIQAKKYTSDPVGDWAPAADAPTVGFKCLKFTVDQPQYYQYNWVSDSDCQTKVGTAFDAIAIGDLDGNSVYSTFDLNGQIPTGQSQIIWAPKPAETNPEE
ncbi:MAG TPA: type II secretion system protein [Polyangiaceae bacterium]|nr:type II secretion system protein [Polyangiaceae bacterium]